MNGDVPFMEKEKTEQSKLIFKRPSPKQTTKFQSLARGLYSLTPFLMIKHSIKGISLSTFFERKRQAGMTVEAAVVLPLFLLFFLNLSCAMEMIRLHGNLQLALQDVGTGFLCTDMLLRRQICRKTWRGLCCPMDM